MQILHDSKKRNAAILVIVGVIAVIVCVMLTEPVGIQVSQSGEERADRPAPNAPGGESAADAEQPQHAGRLTPKQAATAAAPESESQVVIAEVRIVAPDGSPAAEAVFKWRSPMGPIDAGDCVSETTDSDGVLRISLRGPSSVMLTSSDERWSLREKFDLPKGVHPFEFTALPLGTIEILAICDDGQPFAEGRCMVSSGRIDSASLLGFKDASFGLDATLRLDAGGAGVLHGVPLTHDLRLNFLASRIGYSSQRHFIESARIFDGAKFLITLESNPDEERGVLEFDWTGYEAKTIRVLITPPGSNLPYGGGPDSDGPPYRSGLVRPGEYVVRIEGKPGWESEPFRINARSVTRIEYRNNPKTEVMVRVVAEDGQPVANALLTRDHKSYPNLDAPFRPGPLSAVSGSDGMAVLAGVPVGSQTFLIEAKGYEPATLTRELLEGERTDLGTQTLQKCSGKIVVRLVGMAEKQTYSVLLLQPGGSGVRVVNDVAVDTVTLEPLPSRRYVVAVVAGKGGTPASQTVEITAEAPTHDVVLDVSGLTARRMDSE